MKKIFIFLLFILCVPAFSENVYKTNVTASFYGEAFDGKMTSNGETFNMNDFTCAHKSLPFETILKITNLSNNKTVNVRVNDRGPFVIGREIDLSKAAAKKLDMISDGTVKVKIEIVKLGPKTKQSQQTADKAKIMMDKLIAENKDEKQSTSAKPSSSTNKNKLWDIQIGAYKSKENATVKAKELSKAGFSGIAFQKTGTIFRVVIKAVKTEDLPEIERKLKEKGFTEYTVKERTLQ